MRWCCWFLIRPYQAIYDQTFSQSQYYWVSSWNENQKERDYNQPSSNTFKFPFGLKTAGFRASLNRKQTYPFWKISKLSKLVTISLRNFWTDSDVLLPLIIIVFFMDSISLGYFLRILRMLVIDFAYLPILFTLLISAILL